MITQDVPTVLRSDDAREAFDKLFSATFNYVVVLEDDGRVSGIITRTSTAKALGEALWGELPS